MEKIKKIDLIIPVYCEEECIGGLLEQLKATPFYSITIVDANSPDRTREVVKKYAVARYLNSPQKGRAAQMNYGALHTTADYLLFLHADVKLPSNFKEKLEDFLQNNKVEAASFYLQFSSKHWFLKLNAFFSKFNFLAFQFGDQGLLIKRSLFENLGGFNENLLFMEGNDMVKRIKAQTPFLKIPLTLTVSSRKYDHYGVFKLQFAYYAIYVLNYLGISQASLKKLFLKFLG